MRVKDITLEEFVEKYALIVTSKRTLQFGLLLATGASMKEAGNLACYGEQVFINKAVRELEKMGYIESHGTG